MSELPRRITGRNIRILYRDGDSATVDRWGDVIAELDNYVMIPNERFDRLRELADASAAELSSMLITRARVMPKERKWWRLWR